MPKPKNQSFLQKLRVALLAFLVTIGGFIGGTVTRFVNLSAIPSVTQVVQSPSTSLPVSSILSDLSALATLLSLYYAYRAEKRAIKEEEIEEAIEEGRREVQNEEGLEYEEKIDQDIKETIIRNINLQISIFNSALSKHPGWGVKDLAIKDKIAKETHETICGNLKLLKKYNDDKLPPENKRLQGYWEMFKCE